MSANKRRAYRVDNTVLLRDTPLSAASFKEKRLAIDPRSSQSGLISRIAGEELSARSGDHLDANLYKALQIMDQKLNYLISAQIVNDADKLNLSEQNINISIRGMRFVTHNHYKQGDLMEITMMMPGFPPILVTLLAKVRRITLIQADQWDVAVDFVFRNSDEEDTISRHINKRQREMIRCADKRA